MTIAELRGGEDYINTSNAISLASKVHAIHKKHSVEKGL